MQPNYRFPEEMGGSAGGKSAPVMQGRLLYGESMAKHVSWRAGGAVDRAYIPASLDDLCNFLRTVPASEPVHMAGLGSNLLVRDGGLRGVMVLMHAALKRLEIDADGLIQAEAGVASPKVARFAANHGRVGAEFLAGIPGTVGGALAMNAGCYGSETWNHVVRVQTVDRKGELHTRTPQDYELAYRHVALRMTYAEEWFVSGSFRFEAGDGEASRARIKALLEKRIATQPLSQPNAGSVFRNPPGDFAARLIQSCGLKGLRIGNAQVSEKHANFIVNLGGATAADIEALIDRVEEIVVEKTGVSLVREVRIIGENV